MDKDFIANIRLINEKQLLIDKLNESLDELKTTIANTQAEVDSLKEEVLEGMQESNIYEYEDVEGKLFVNKFSRHNVGYTDEKAVIETLKSIGMSNLIRIKTTEALDKTPLKKELKANAALSEALKPYVLDSTTNYVVVTTEASHAKMLEAMEGNRK